MTTRPVFHVRLPTRAWAVSIGRGRCGRSLDGERYLHVVAGRREPEWLRCGRDCPPFRRREVEGARGAVACGRHLDLDLSFGPRGEEPHVGQGPEDDGGDHFQWASRLPFPGGLNGDVADLQSLVANLESVRDRESRRSSRVARSSRPN